VTDAPAAAERPRRRACRRGCAAAAGVLGLLLAYLALWPVPVEPVAWTPPPAPELAGPYAANDRLAAAEVLAIDGEGPEDVAVDAAGRIYAGLVDGRIVRLAPEGGGQETLVDTGGRPLGLDLDGAGRLVVVDPRRGELLRVSTGDGGLEVLAREEGGRPFAFANDVDVGPDGAVYFSDSSVKHGIEDILADLVESGPNGRLLRWDPATGAVERLLDGLCFANGVAVSPDGAFVLVAETSRYRIRRLWLEGPRAGEDEVFAENLPGFPDGIAVDRDGVFWLALAAPRSALVDWLLPRPTLRKPLARIPARALSRPSRHALVLGFDAQGEVVANLQAEGAEAYAPVTSVEPVGDRLYLGSLAFPGVARLTRPRPRSE